METKFENIITGYEAQLGQDTKLFDKLGYAKLLGILLLIVCVVFLFTSGFALLVVLVTIIFLTALVILWVWHYRLDNKIMYARGIVAICSRQIDRITGGWAAFEDIGSEFIDFAHPYACDLDIVGSKSLFQFLNTTHTWHGRQIFAGDLLRPSYSITDIIERQAAIEELSKDIDFANDIQYYLSQIGVNSRDEELVKELTVNKPFMKSTLLKFLISYVPVITIILLFSGWIFQVQPLLFTGFVFLAVQPLLCIFSGCNAGKYLGLMHRLPYKLGKYVKVIDILRTREFTSHKLNRIKFELEIASGAVKELEKIGNALSIMSNPVIYIALNWLLLWDFHCAFRLERWKAKYSHSAGRWLAAIGEFESLLAFSHLPNTCGNVCLPTVREGGKVLDAKDLGHPLLSNGLQNEVVTVSHHLTVANSNYSLARVCNNVAFDNNIFIISGSNMSGKTTFMRTVGVSLLLARAGSFVCAREMICSRFDIITSMRVADDLNQGVSTFYAELKRVKLIIDMAEQNPHMIFLIDEIFKGTNSVDRLAGADAVISKLEKLGAAGMVTTHDLELCKLANFHDRIENYSFCETYRDGEIHFDYKMRKGQSKTTNARFLMEMIGIQ